MTNNFSSIIKELEKENGKLLNNFKITKIKVFPQKKQCIIYFLSNEHLSCDDLGCIENKIKALQYTGDIILKYSVNKPLIKNYLKDNWMILANEVCEKIPSVRGWLDKAEYETAGDVLLIKLTDQIGFDILEMKDVPSLIQQKIINETGVNIKVNLNVNDELEHDQFYKDYYIYKENKERQLTEELLKLNDSLNQKENVDFENTIIMGKKIPDEPINIKDINGIGQRVTIQGKVFDVQEKHIRDNFTLLIISITDFTNSIYVKIFQKIENTSIISKIKLNKWLKITGQVEYDNYQKAIVINPSDINLLNKIDRTDTYKDKRVELHLHTNMSTMDGISPPRDYIKRAAQWGHSALAITDHGVVQAFPEAYQCGHKYGIKIIFGVEAFIIDDEIEIIKNPKIVEIEKETYVILDIETTGLSALKDEIIEIGAVKLKDGKIVDKFHSLIKPHRTIPYEIETLTGVTNSMVKDSPSIESVMPDFIDFIGDSTIVAHNASFDLGFIYRICQKHHLPLNNSVLDTLNLSRALLKKLKNHKLKTITAHYNIKLLNHHRAIDDAKATSEILLELIKLLKEKGINNLSEINELRLELLPNHIRPNHALILVKNHTGLKNLYKLISRSHLKHYFRTPRIPKSELSSMRQGLLIGSGCQAGEIYKGIINGISEEEINEKCKFYDFLEVQPIMNNYFLINKGLVEDTEALKLNNKYIYRLGKSLGIPVVATGDVHFLDPEDETYKRILLYNQGFEDSNEKTPLFFRTTNEMLEEFKYLGEKTAEEIVICNTKKIADMIEDVNPIPDGLYTPKIDGAEQMITEMTYKNAKKLYGDPLPTIVEERIRKELYSIVNNGFAVIYLISHKLVNKSLEDGYLVGSRGSVGSSLCATMCGITEVNPLPPHYICPNCKFNEFIVDEKYGTGIDLPDKECPICRTNLKKEGFNIPFEVFMGFKGDKVPDIDLNFSGEYQAIAHKYVEELFGDKYVYRAGTIGTIAERTAYGFVKGFLDQQNNNFHKAEIDRLVKGCTGIKRTTGQHPGGLIVVPKDFDIHDFTPIQYPADDKSSKVITTHFEYHAISDILLKLDILGHDDPTTLKMLYDITEIDPKTIPLDDKETMDIFSSLEPLNLKNNDIDTLVGTLGVPEFGTKFVRQMLEDTNPTTFSELIRISGLSHGTDVWINNAQKLIKDKTATLSEVISTRDDIMTNLIQLGMDPHKSFKIMEKVRKGKGIDENDKILMKQHNVKDWFIESCKKIKYMFPKAHAVAYVIMAFRIAYFKVHYPYAFYTAYFSIKADEFDADVILKGPKSIKNRIQEIENSGNTMTQKEKNQLTILEVALEAYNREIRFQPVNLYKSDAEKFILINETILLPFNSLQGVGKTAAQNIVKAREEGKFLSVEDLRARAKLTKKAIDALKRHGCLRSLPESNQLNFFTLAY